MSAYSLQQAKEMVSFYVDAEQKVLLGKNITKDGRSWGREDLGAIRKGRQEWESTVKKLSGTYRSGPSVVEFC